MRVDGQVHAFRIDPSFPLPPYPRYMCARQVQVCTSTFWTRVSDPPTPSSTEHQLPVAHKVNRPHQEQERELGVAFQHMGHQQRTVMGMARMWRRSWEVGVMQLGTHVLDMISRISQDITHDLNNQAGLHSACSQLHHIQYNTRCWVYRLEPSQVGSNTWHPHHNT